uniref:protein FAR1-RELATED SEQUENCE 5-like n=1 Tax=Erigeron canadensis TaxID=72917 RepID=UPI001CB8E881|nr:protein FAR1-RELATED SEQUENCE 5-like [Erigeron canadensis]
MNQSEQVFLATSQFETYDELLRSVRSFYYAKGYGLSIRDSRKGKHVILQCDRGGSHKEPAEINRKRSTTSRLTNCPFQIVGKRGADGFWAFTVKNLTHNHEPSKDMSGHSSFRQLSPNKVKTVKEMTMSGIPARQILSSLRLETPSLPANSRTIYNLKKKIRREKLGNRPMINALFEELEKAGFTYDIVHDLDGRITRLFIAHPLSVKLAKHFSSTFVMDCTYKTNKYNMPLLISLESHASTPPFILGSYFWRKRMKKIMFGR